MALKGAWRIKPTLTRIITSGGRDWQVCTEQWKIEDFMCAITLLPNLPKTLSPIMSRGEKRAHHSHHHRCHGGRCAHHPLLCDGATSWEHSLPHHGNRPLVQPGGVFYNQPEPLSPECIHTHTHTHIKTYCIYIGLPSVFNEHSDLIQQRGAVTLKTWPPTQGLKYLSRLSPGLILKPITQIRFHTNTCGDAFRFFVFPLVKMLYHMFFRPVINTNAVVLISKVLLQP